MSICWYCHWGWPKPIGDIYQEALKRLYGDWLPLHFGPSHVVWEDENFDSAQWCLDNFDKYGSDYSDEELEVVKWSLEELVKVPDIYKDWPEEYDGNNPQDYPPPEGWEMVRVSYGG